VGPCGEHRKSTDRSRQRRRARRSAPAAPPRPRSPVHVALSCARDRPRLGRHHLDGVVVRGPPWREGRRPAGDDRRVGAANLAAGLFQGFPVSTSGSRTAVAEQARKKTQVTGLAGAERHRADPSLLPRPAAQPVAADELERSRSRGGGIAPRTYRDVLSERRRTGRASLRIRKVLPRDERTTTHGQPRFHRAFRGHHQRWLALPENGR
jgi:hypothetical protein